MFDTDERDLHRDVEASMRMFKNAQVGPAAAIQPQIPRRVLVALDGSEQDGSSTGAAVHLQRRFGCQTFVLDAREQATGSSELAAKTAEAIPEARAIDRSEGPAYDAIVQAVADREADLVILPCPFGREFQSVGSDSAGTVIDVMLRRCRAAMLVIRRGDQSLDGATDEIAILVGSEIENERLAAAWAIGLAHERSRLSLDLVVDKKYYEDICQLLEVLSPEKSLDLETLSEAMEDAHARLHAALSRTAAEASLQYALRPLAIEDAPPNLADSARPLLIVLPLEQDDRFGQGFVQDRIRRSPHPLLVIPSVAGPG